MVSWLGRSSVVDRRLGRGLDFFLSKKGSSSETAAPPSEGVAMVEISQLVPNPRQPRKEIPEGELDELARSIQSAGVLQPILARKVGKKLQIVAGERRWRAARRAALERIPVLIREISDDQSALFALVENVQRTDLNPMEKAAAFKSLQGQLKCSQEELARKVGLDRSSVANFMRLLELPASVQAHVSRGTLSMGHARALLGLRPGEVESVAEQAIRKKLSVRRLEGLVRQVNETTGKKSSVKAAQPKRQAWLVEIEETLVEALSTPVRVHYGTKRSRIIIECAGREEFERIYDKLKEIDGKG